MEAIEETQGEEQRAADKLCVFCTQFETSSPPAVWWHFPRLSLVDEIPVTTCQSHQPLFDLIRLLYSSKYPSGTGPFEAGVAKLKEPLQFFNVDVGTGPAIGIVVSETPLRSFQYCPQMYNGLRLARSKHEPQTVGYGRILDRDWIDMDLVKSWLKTCICEHGQKCENPLKITPVSPAWLIDTSMDCMVPGDGIVEYLTLSYVWGRSRGFRNTRKRIEELSKAGTLSRADVSADIPPVIRHAMHLVRAIGERYLWADTMCIVQDDEAHIARQLVLMGAIYASSKLTIIQTDGDALDGILGLKTVSNSREVEQEVVPLSSGEKIVGTEPMGDFPAFLPETSVYAERGWTFQEGFMSKRRLIFSERQLAWDCSSALWHELQINSASSTGTWAKSSSIASILSGRPDFDALDTLIRRYNGRELTYDEDALPAVSGLLTILAPHFDGGFLFGLPETFFDSALVWSPQDGTNLRRRKHSGRMSSLLPGSYLPSWSWIGWQGKIRLMQEEKMDDDLRGCKTTRITQWFTHETPHAARKRPIRGSWFDLRQQFEGRSIFPRGDWTKEDYNSDKHRLLGSPPEGLGRYVYTNPAIPGRHFWSPVPLATDWEKRESCSSPQTPYISCRTRRGWFKVTKYEETLFTEYTSRNEMPKRFARITDDYGSSCGCLRLHTTEDHSLFPEANSNQFTAIELVAVCLQRSLSSKVGPVYDHTKSSMTIIMEFSGSNGRMELLTDERPASSRNKSGSNTTWKTFS